MWCDVVPYVYEREITHAMKNILFKKKTHFLNILHNSDIKNRNDDDNHRVVFIRIEQSFNRLTKQSELFNNPFLNLTLFLIALVIHSSEIFRDYYLIKPIDLPMFDKVV